MVCVQKISVAEHEVKYRVRISIGVLWVSSEDIIYRSSIVEARWNLAIAVETRVAARVGQALQLLSFGRCNHAKVWVAISTSHLKIKPHPPQPCLKPILKVEFLVRAAHTLNQRSLPDGFDAVLKD